MEKIFRKNTIAPLLGNEAIVVGALEAGVGFVSTYPGTPASEIGNVFYKIKEAYGITMEYSTNEKVSVETAAGAAFSGVRALVAMKNFGSCVAMDALIPIAYSKPRAGLVIIIADDPGCHSSAQSEQDSRVFIQNLHIPTLEPSDPREAREFTTLAFKLSEFLHKPVIIRTTTRVAHQTTAVRIGRIPKAKTTGTFIRDADRFTISSDKVLVRKEELLKLEKAMEAYIDEAGLNPILSGKNKQFGIIASGAGYLYGIEAMNRLKTPMPILKIDSYFPLPIKRIRRFVSRKKSVLVVEEILGLIEERIRSEINAADNSVNIVGKRLLPPVGELDSDRVTEALARMIGHHYRPYKKRDIKLPVRTPRFCEGCPYWSIYSAIKSATTYQDKASRTKIRNDVVLAGDIGCHIMGYYPPFELQDTLLCMGASAGVSHGISRVTNQKVIAMMGDSTLLHSGFAGLLNIVNNHSNPLVIIFENGITGMTGRQPHAGTPLKHKVHDGKAEIHLEDLFKAIGMKYIILDPVAQYKTLEKTIKESIASNEPMAILCRKPCIYIGELEKGGMRV